MPCSKNGDRKLPTAGEELANAQNQCIQFVVHVMFLLHEPVQHDTSNCCQLVCVCEWWTVVAVLIPYISCLGCDHGTGSIDSNIRHERAPVCTVISREYCLQYNVPGMRESTSALLFL